MVFDAESVRAIAERVAASSGLEVAEVELRGGGKVNAGDIAVFSRQLATMIEAGISG